jgi:serine phosphatase RsbU (regulator of sigma subunit)
VSVTGDVKDRIESAGSGLPPLSDWARLALLLEGSSFPAALWSGAELRFRWTNRAFLDLMDDARPQWDLLGMPVRGFLSDTRSAVRFIDAAYTGQAFTDPEYEYHASWGETSFWQLSYLPMPARIGDPFDVLLLGIDVTPQVSMRRAIEREHADLRSAMGLINTTILSSLDAEEILQRVLVEATEAFKADWGWLAERENGSWVFRNVHGWPTEMIGLSFREDELSLPSLAARSCSVEYATGTKSVSDEHLELMQRHDIGAFLMVPVLHRGQATGVMGFCWDVETPFTPAMVELAEKLAVSLSLALENARLYDSERRITRTLQSALFSAPASVPGLQLGHLYHSASAGAHVGGDFYDVIQLENQRLGLMVGDVAGRGVEVAALTTLIKSAMRAEAMRLPSPGSVLGHANDIMLRGGAPEEFATAFFGLLDNITGHFSYCLAGHPSPVLLRDGADPVFLAEPHMVLGVRQDSRYNASETVLDPGDLLVMYTDGLTEAKNRHGERYGTDRLLENVAMCAAEPAEEVPESLFLSAFSFADGHLEDDVAIMALRRTGSGPDGIVQGRLELACA